MYACSWSYNVGQYKLIYVNGVRTKLKTEVVRKNSLITFKINNQLMLHFTDV